MRRELTATILAAALAVTQGAATPSKAADAEKVLGVLLGIGAIYAIGKAIEQNQAQAREPVRRNVVPERIRPHLVPEPVRRYAPHESKRPNHRWSERRMTLPEECLYRFETRDGPLVGFGRNCLEHTLHRTNRLPDSCAFHTRIGDKRRTIYSARCLRLEGWRVAGSASSPVWRPGGRLGG